MEEKLREEAKPASPRAYTDYPTERAYLDGRLSLWGEIVDVVNRLAQPPEAKKEAGSPK